MLTAQGEGLTCIGPLTSRFYSGPIYKMKSVRKYDFYWRLDSVGVEYHCDIKFDPFVYMQERNIVYALTVALHEYPETVPTLWNVTLKYGVTL